MRIGYIFVLLIAGLYTLVAQEINLGDGPVLVSGGGGGIVGAPTISNPAGGISNIGPNTDNRPRPDINQIPVSNAGGINLGGGNQRGPPSITPTGGSGGVIVVDDEGTIIPSSGTTTNNNNNDSNKDKTNTNTNNNNNAGGDKTDFNSFGPVNFPSFGNFGTSGGNLPNLSGYNNNPGTTPNNNNNNNNNNNADNNNFNANNFNNINNSPGSFFSGSNFPSSFPGFSGNGNTNPANNNNNNNINNNNNNVPTIPSGGSNTGLGFPNLGSINFDFGIGNGGNSGFPSDFGGGEGTGFFPGLPGGSPNFPRPGGGGSPGGGINLPPIRPTNPGSGFGSSSCQPPTSTYLDTQFSGDVAPTVVTNGIIQEASVRPEVLALANFFGTLVGNTNFVPPQDDPMQSCPANYTQLTKFVTSANLECWLLPPPYQEPVFYADCRCSQCQDNRSPLSRYGGYNNININSNSGCRPHVANVTVVSYCRLLTTARIVPYRLEVPMSCRCQKLSTTTAGPYNFRNN